MIGIVVLCREARFWVFTYAARRNIAKATRLLDRAERLRALAQQYR